MSKKTTMPKKPKAISKNHPGYKELMEMHDANELDSLIIFKSIKNIFNLFPETNGFDNFISQKEIEILKNNSILNQNNKKLKKLKKSDPLTVSELLSHVDLKKPVWLKIYTINENKENLIIDQAVYLKRINTNYGLSKFLSLFSDTDLEKLKPEDSIQIKTHFIIELFKTV